MRNVGHPGNIERLQAWIADGLPDHQTGIGADCRGELLQLSRLHEGGGNAEPRQCVGEQIDAAAIKRGRGDDMVSGVEQRRNRKVQRRHAAGRADRAHTTFKRGEPLFENGRGRIRNPSVDVSGAFKVEQRRGMFEILKDVRSSLINRDRTGARDGIRMLAGMEAQGLERGRLGCGHVELGK